MGKKTPRTLRNSAPLFEMAHDDLLGLVARAHLLNPPNVQRPILAVEAAHTAHVVAIVRELVPGEAVLGAIGECSIRVR